ncbi:glycerol-3-phosphate acyltransferase PlsY [Entomoplasma freundtii]|uniref:Glycerol-3-phosphate acyltransferase n=1 Tax=Entomoplasma freundtii TaxID=74700 RepID=A0A2K8NRA2_9MOLU|nr:glycerol-3-phosphate 1-O-acyltransferase PlsY [Entomoplasma freundtii]ATZ16349.1 glycerol-3-phosphate acyltransferase PlsY [Entomoplasma freundtii]TDY56612.1 glycerol-3-phosphate acyltransferase PlsY [Entomoplasma freundtii]
MHYLGIILGSLIGYFIGSISWSIIIVRQVKGIDVRTVGSKNAGATNTMRELGKRWGLVVVFLDGLKSVTTALICFLLSMIPSTLFSETSYFIPVLFVMIGHCYPIYYRFKGGKAVACFLGLLCIANIFYLLFFLAVWFIMVAISKRVSVASVVAALLTGLLFIWLPWVSGLNNFPVAWNSYEQWSEVWSNGWLRFSWMNYLHEPAGKISGYWFADSLLEINIVILVGMATLAYRHFPNIKRLKKHQEPETFPHLSSEEKVRLISYQKDRSLKGTKMSSKKRCHSAKGCCQRFNKMSIKSK